MQLGSMKVESKLSSPGGTHTSEVALFEEARDSINLPSWGFPTSVVYWRVKSQEIDLQATLASF